MRNPVFRRSPGNKRPVRKARSRRRFFFPGIIIMILAGVLAILSHSGFSLDDMAAAGSFANFRSSPEPQPVQEEILFVNPFSPEDLAFYEDTLTHYLLDKDFNGTVLLAKEGVILYERAFGFADFRDHTPLRRDTPFQLASISKTFTATAVLMLQEDSLLHIDEHLVKYIPEFPYPEMTIRQMLNHTSGIQNYMWLVERYWQKEQPPTNEDVLQLFLRYPRPLNFTPGTRFGYSNTGYTFLALLIERVSGKRYPDFLRERIFEPLEMHNSFVYDLHQAASPRADRAYGFRRGWRAPIVIPDGLHDGVMGDKGIWSNIHDLYKWDQSIYNNTLLPQHVWNEAFERTRLRNERTVSYGQGWRLQTFLDMHVVHHPGRWSGFRTSLKRFMDGKATLILLSNTERDISPLVNNLQHILFFKEIQMMADTPSVEKPMAYEEEGDELGGE
jgi:CubicO group peptidase (beta-lactamase class C family)